MKSRRLLAWFVGLAAAVASGAANPPPQPAAASAAATTTGSLSRTFDAGPAYGWTFPVFTDNDGYHVYTLRGSEARILGPDRIEVSGFSAIVFSGDASERVDEVLLSPEATFFPKEARATGSSSVRLLLSGRPDTENDDVEVLGRGWTYDHNTKKVSIAHDVRVTFHAQLHDILK